MAHKGPGPAAAYCKSCFLKDSLHFTLRHSRTASGVSCILLCLISTPQAVLSKENAFPQPTLAELTPTQSLGIISKLPSLPPWVYIAVVCLSVPHFLERDDDGRFKCRASFFFFFREG